MKLAKNLLIATVGVALALGLYVFMKNSRPPAPAVVEPVATSTPVVQEVIYSNATYGMRFSYPSGYVMKEEDHSDAHRKHTTISLVREEDAVPPEGGEGPTAIALDIYQNDLDKQSLNDWLNTAVSNFKLSNGSFASTTVSATDAIQYTWSGLYEGETTAFLHKDNVVAVSVTYFSPEDQNVAVYRNLLQTLRLQ